MIRPFYWQQVPSTPVLDALPGITWSQAGYESPATGTAALMLYVALCFMAEKLEDDHGSASWVAAGTYDDLSKATELSRPLISQGLRRLIAGNLIRPEGSRQKRRYHIIWEEGGWFKLPCQAIVKSGVILPFKHFSLRSKYEMHAMKLYLYLAAVRSNTSVYSTASYEKIFKRIGVSERDVRRAIIILTSCGLLENVERETSLNEDGEKVYGPNKYFLKGHRNLPASAKSSPEANPTAAISAPRTRALPV